MADQGKDSVAVQEGAGCRFTAGNGAAESGMERAAVAGKAGNACGVPESLPAGG